jgi:hypothetical protein
VPERAFYQPLAADPPDPDFRETVAGGHALVLEHASGHALVIEYGDVEFYFRCQCGRDFTPIPLRPDKPWLPVLAQWLAHCPPTLPPEIAPHCQCGKALLSSASGSTSEATLDDVSRAWERHCMTEVNS